MKEKKDKQYFIKEINRLLENTDGINYNFRTVENFDEEKKCRCLLISKISELKSTDRRLPRCVQFEVYFELYQILNKYYELFGKEKFRGVLKEDLIKSGEKYDFQFIKRTLRVFHMFNYLYSKECSTAHFICELSVQDIYALTVKDWSIVAKEFGFYEMFTDDESKFMIWSKKEENGSRILLKDDKDNEVNKMSLDYIN